MLYMVIERFKNNDAKPVYQRFDEKGRMMPEGLRYLHSWVDLDMSVCFQLMECENSALLDQWMGHWNDLVEFEVIQVRTSADTVAASASLLGASDARFSER